MNRGALYLIIAVLIVVGIAMSYQLYNERHKTEGVIIDVGKNGIWTNPRRGSRVRRRLEGLTWLR